MTRCFFKLPHRLWLLALQTIQRWTERWSVSRWGHRQLSQRTLLSIDVLERRLVLAAPMMLGDLDPTPDSKLSSWLPGGFGPVTEFEAVGDWLFFNAKTRTSNGYQLFKTDGTNVVQVTDFLESVELGPWQLTNVNGTLFFSGESPGQGTELWKSDGTRAGTILVKDIHPGTVDSEYGTFPKSSFPRYLINANGTLYFTANDGTHGQELWKSNGTAAGTVMVKDIKAGIGGSYPRKLTNTLTGVLLFDVPNDVHYDMWRTNGTAAGTQPVETFTGGTVFPKTYIFPKYTPETGVEPWAYDGVTLQQVGDLYPGPFSSSPVPIQEVPGVQVYMVANDGTHGAELWRVKRDTEGDQVAEFVKDIYLGSLRSKIGESIVINGIIYFVATDATSGQELWKSDGTPSGTVRISDFFPGVQGSSIGRFQNLNGNLLFAATLPPPAGSTSGLGFELYILNTSTITISMVREFRPGDAGFSDSTPGPAGSAAVFKGSLYFFANDGSTGYELWKTNGTAATTVLVDDIDEGTVNSYLSAPRIAGDKLFFTTKEPTAGQELWVSDGTVAGTKIVKDINPGTRESSPSPLANVNGQLFFVANDGTTGRELWKSDGTSAGTTLVKDIVPGLNGQDIAHFAEFNGQLYFNASDLTSGFELWKSDGTTAGTNVLLDIIPGATASFPMHFANVGGSLFFWAMESNQSGRRLFKSDGTVAGTTPISTDLNLANLTNIQNYRQWVVGNTLYFTYWESATGVELWKSDGTAAGTVLVKDLVPGNASSLPRFVNNTGNTLFFTIANVTTGVYELWKTDGTSSGTVKVISLFSPVQTLPIFESPDVPGSANVNGTLYFAARSGVFDDYALWKTDGTTAGTSILFQRTDSGPTMVSSLVNVNGTLYFSAKDDGAGQHLWKTNGTPATTSLVSDTPHTLWPQVANGNSLFLVGIDQLHGRNLWHMQTAINQAPEIEPVGDLELSEEETLNVPLNGISAGKGETGPVRVTVTSNKPELLSANLSYNSPEPTGSIQLTAQLDQVGIAVLSITIEDGGDDGLLDTPIDNLKVIQEVNVEVSAINDSPTIGPIENVIVKRSNATVDVMVKDLGAGGNEHQPLAITASSNRPELFTAITAKLDGVSSGLVSISPVGLSGNATITVTIEDGGLDQDLNTTFDNLSSSTTFQFILNDAPIAVPDQFELLTGQKLILRPLANDTDDHSLPQNLEIQVTTPLDPAKGSLTELANGEMEYTPAPGFKGIARFEYSVSDEHGETSNPVEVRIGVAGSPKQNPWWTFDVTRDSQVSPIDALIIINHLNDGNLSNRVQDYAAPFSVDVNGDYFISALDALLVINYLNAPSSGEGETMRTLDFNPTTSTSSVVNHRGYDAFGNRVTQSGTVDFVFGYVGKYFDPYVGKKGSGAILID